MMGWIMVKQHFILDNQINWENYWDFLIAALL